jgi:hypothetical protein
MAVATVDGELGLYSTDRFLSGEARDFKTGKPLLLTWDEHGCRMVLVRSGSLDATNCNLDGVTKSIPTDSRWAVSPRGSRNRNGIYAVTQPTKIILWDDYLNQIAEISSPEGRHLSAALDLTFNSERREVFIVMDKEKELWTFNIDEKSWRVAATLPFSIRSLGTLPNGTVVVGSEEGAEIVALDIETGQEKFRTGIPGADTIRLFPSQTSDVLYVAAVARQHGLYRLDARSGQLTSSNINRFSGPAHLLAASSDGRHLVLEGVGVPDGRANKGFQVGGGFGLELWDAERLMPLGEGVRTEDYDQEAVAFSPDQSKVAMALTSPPRIVILPLGLQDWVSSACRMAGRSLDAGEKARYSFQEKDPCVESSTPTLDVTSPELFLWTQF